MTDRVQCLRCKQSILATTAAKNDGICTRCLKEPAAIHGQAILSLLAAAGLAILGVLAFLWFWHLEAQGGQVRTHALIILAYSILGTWGVLVFVLGFFRRGVRPCIAETRKGRPRQDGDRGTQTACQAVGPRDR